MAATQIDPFSARSTFDTGSGTAALFRLRALDDAGVTNTGRLPYCLRTILEALLRTCDDYEVTEQDVRNLATWESDFFESKKCILLLLYSSKSNIIFIESAPITFPKTYSHIHY